MFIFLPFQGKQVEFMKGSIGLLPNVHASADWM